jgi:hypothetical protein
MKVVDRLTMQRPREMVTKTKTTPLEATRNKNQQIMGAKNEEAVMTALGEDGHCG